MSTPDRSTPFARQLDALDTRIAGLIAQRDALMQRMPDDYDCDGEGEAYFGSLPGDRAVDVLGPVARLDE